MVKYEQPMTTDEIINEIGPLVEAITGLTNLCGDTLLVSIITTSVIMNANIKVLKNAGASQNLLEMLEELLKTLRSANTVLMKAKSNFKMNYENN